MILPPTLAEHLLTRLIKGRDGQAIAGDLAEAYEARGGGRLWYWGQVFSCLLVRISPHRRLTPDLGRDMHQALRVIRRNPGYALASMLCLALGIGVNTTVFSALDGMFLRKLPVPEPQRVITLDRDGGPAMGAMEYFQRRSAIRSLEGAVAVIPRITYLDVDRANDQIHIETVTANYASVLKTPARIGRWFIPSDEGPGGGFPVVISDRIWMRHFQRDPSALGKTVRIENKAYLVVGVADPVFTGVSAPVVIDAWVPLASYPINRAQFQSATDRAGPEVFIVGRLKPDATLQSARAEAAVLDAQLLADRGSSAHVLKGPLEVRVVSGFPSTRAQRQIAPLIMLLAGVVAIVLLIACVNVANLLLSRATVRRREMAVRLALGATRWRLIRLALTEGVVLAAGGATLGLVLGYWTNQALLAWLPATTQFALRTVILEINWHVVAMTALCALACALLFSLAPALESARSNITPALKGQEGGMSVKRAAARRDWYAVAQVALSLVLLVGAGLLLRALNKVSNLHPGFATSHRLYVRLFTPQPDFTPQTSTALFTRLTAQARNLPGVRDATLSFAMLGFGDRDCASPNPADPARKLQINVVAPNYFQMMRVDLLRGAGFTATPGQLREVIVNETMAKQWFPGQDPVGKRLWFGCDPAYPKEEARVIGLARDSKYMSLGEAPTPLYYASAQQYWWNGFFALIIETEGNPQDSVKPLLDLVHSAGPKLRVYEVNTLDGLIALSLWNARFYASLISIFSLLAVTLSAIGLYGVVAYSVSQRTREIGIRVAIGASRSDVRWMVLGRALRLSVWGILIGLAISAAVTPLLRTFLYGLHPLDPAALAAAALTWIAVAMLASYLPSLRATRVDPAVALRYE